MHLNRYHNKMLSNGAELQRHLFMAKVGDPNKSMHYTGKNKLFYHFDVEVAKLHVV